MRTISSTTTLASAILPMVLFQTEATRGLSESPASHILLERALILMLIRLPQTSGYILIWKILLKMEAQATRAKICQKCLRLRKATERSPQRTTKQIALLRLITLNKQKPLILIKLDQLLKLKLETKLVNMRNQSRVILTNKLNQPLLRNPRSTSIVNKKEIISSDSIR